MIRANRKLLAHVCTCARTRSPNNGSVNDFYHSDFVICDLIPSFCHDQMPVLCFLLLFGSIRARLGEFNAHKWTILIFVELQRAPIRHPIQYFRIVNHFYRFHAAASAQPWWSAFKLREIIWLRLLLLLFVFSEIQNHISSIPSCLILYQLRATGPFFNWEHSRFNRFLLVLYIYDTYHVFCVHNAVQACSAQQ